MDFDDSSIDPTKATVKTEDGGDVFSPAAAGSKTLRLREGALRIRDINLAPGDDVIAGTNLFGASTSPAQQALADTLGINPSSLPGSNSDPINYEKLAAAMSNVTITAIMDPMGSSTTMTTSPWSLTV